MAAMAQAKDVAHPAGGRLGVLLRQFTTLFFTDEPRGAADLAAFEDVAGRIVGLMDAGGLIDFAEQIAGIREAPHALVLDLARREIEIARPVLIRSPVLGDDDLAGIAGTGDEATMLAIVERAALATAVTDALLRRGSQDVARTLAGHAGARFTTYGFGTLLDHARNDETLQRRLATRQDMPANVLAELSPIITEKLRRDAVRLGGTAPDSLSAAVLEGLRSRMRAGVAEPDRESRPIGDIIADIRAGRATVNQEVAQLAKADRAYDLATLLSDLVSMEHAQAMRALTGTSDETLVVMFRLLEIEWPTFEAVLQLRARRLRRNYIPSANLMTAYQDMDRTTAQRVLQLLSRR